jgi:biopolymer transport protein ExbB
MILLQVTQTTPLDTAAMSEGEASISFIELLFKGGFMMIPIILLSFLAVYIFFERYLSIKKAARTPNAFMNKVKRLVSDGDVKGARLLCAQEDTPVAKMIEKGISRIGSPLKNIEVTIENQGKIEVYNLEKNLSYLATISGAAPMIGFLGTVTGMIQAFMAMANEEGQISPKLLSSGIYEAMITTASGLLVGIIAYLGYNFLVARVQKLIHRMEYTSIDFIDLLQEPH